MSVNVFHEIDRRLAALEARARNLLRLGFVEEVLPAEGKVRVRLMDADCMRSYKLPVLASKTRCDKEYWMPDLGEQVLCCFLGLGLERGFVLGAYYNDLDVVPVVSPEKHHVRYLDGTWLEYDRSTGEMRIECRGRVTIGAGEIWLKTPVLKCPEPEIVSGAPEPIPVVPSPLPEIEEWPYD